MTNYYVPEFYIKNFFLSFAGLVIIGFLVYLIFENSSSLYFSYGCSILIAIIGVTIIGYNNASRLRKEKEGKPLLLHLSIIIVLFLTNSIWGESSILINLIRELSFLILLQFGVYLFNKKGSQVKENK